MNKQYTHITLRQVRLWVIWLLLGGSCCAWADDIVEQPQTLDELLSRSFTEIINYDVISPTKTRAPITQSPAAISVIPREVIQRSGATSIPELLRNIPGVHVRWNPMVQHINIRSFGSNPFTTQILLLIDGIPYNSWNKGGFPQHPGLDFFILDSVKRIEVIRGPSSNLYGENALNGVINIITLSGEEFDKTRIRGSLSDNDTYETTLVAGTKINDSHSILFNARHYKSILPTEFWLKNNAFTENNEFYVKYKGPNLQLTWYRKSDSTDGVSQAIELPQLPPNAIYRTADKIEQTVNLYSAQYNRTAASERWDFQANTSYANRHGGHCATCHSSSADDRFDQSVDHGYQWFSNAQLNIKQGNAHKWTLGIEHRKINAASHADEFAHHHSAHAGHSQSAMGYDKYAGFLQHQWKLNNSGTEVTAGLRYDTETEDLNLPAEWLPRIALVHPFNEQLTARFSWSRATRYPSLTERAQANSFFEVDVGGNQAPIVVAEFMPNFQLAPERITASEASLYWQPKPNLRVNIDTYHNYIDDPIVAIYPNIHFENHRAKARIRGVEVGVDGQFKNGIHAFANWSYQDSKQRGTGTDSQGNALEFTYAPNHKVNLGGNWRWRDHYNAYFEAQWVDGYVGPAFWYPITFGNPEIFDLPSYWRVNMRLSRDFSFAGHEAQVFMRATNLSNERPRESLGGFDSRIQGRVFTLGLQVDFGH